MKPVLFGCAGPELAPAERAFFAIAQPFGFILFRRNCATPPQVRALVGALREAVGRPDAPVFIDQEGGRVARLAPPAWPSFPPLRRIGALYERDPEAGISALRLHVGLTAHMLRDLGIDGNCAPVLDLLIEGASSALGDRAFSRSPAVVTALGRVAVDAFLEGGVMPVIKHMPGHGRVDVDPHEKLPVVRASRELLEAEDFVPFRALKDAPAGMNCHALFTALDERAPVSLSARIHREVLRGTLGFEGFLMSDDVAMNALEGTPQSRALRALEAGADCVLYCPGLLPEMQAIAAALPEMAPKALERWARARARLPDRPPAPLALAEGLARLQALLAPVALSG